VAITTSDAASAPDTAIRRQPDALTSVRRDVCTDVAALLAGVGLHMRVGGWLLRDRWLEAMSLVTQMMGQLGQASVVELGAKRWYAGSALLRQVFETQYLLAAFAKDHAAADKWLDSSDRQLQRHFAPAALRRAGGFQDGEYRTHCMLGGHPHPKSSWLLPDRAPEDEVADLMWPDLAQHLTESWFVLLRSLEPHPARDQVITADAVAVSAKVAEWKATDPLAHRIAHPNDGLGSSRN
jgi:hypothetical protein